MSILTEGKTRHHPKKVTNKVPIVGLKSLKPKLSTYAKVGDSVLIKNFSKEINGKIGIVRYRDGDYIGVKIDSITYELYPNEMTVIQ